MSETSSNAPAAPGGGDAPNPANYIEALPDKPAKRSNLFTDPDGAAEEALAKAKPQAPKPRTGPPTKRETRAAEAEVDELLNDDSVGFRSGDRPDDDEPDDEPEEKPRRKPKAEPEDVPDEVADDDEADPDEEPAEPLEGTKKRPHKREDLPEDVFVEVKVDGEKQVVSLKELADGFSGQKAIAKRLAAIGEREQTAQRQVHEARQEMKASAEYFNRLIHTPAELYKMLTSTDKLEGVYQALFEHRYKQLTEWEKNPTARARFLYERNARAIDEQRKVLDARREAVQQEEHSAKMEQHRMSIIRPGYVEGLRRAQLSNNKNLPPELIRDAQAWLEIRVRELGDTPMTSDDVAQAVVFSARKNGIKPDGAPPPRKNIIPPRGGAPQARRATSSDKRFEGMTKAQKSMDPDWLSRNIRLRKG